MIPFPKTEWSQLAKATLHGQTEARMAMEEFCRSYMEPVRNFIRYRFANENESEDLTQEFLLHVMEHSVLRRADRERGKFRSFLLGALMRFLGDKADHRRAQKRGGLAEHTSLSALPDHSPEAPSTQASDIATFDREWAMSIMERALERIRDEASSSSEQRRFEVLQCFLPRGSKPLAYDDAARELGIGLAALKTEVHRLRKRFRTLVREEVALTVSAPHEIDQEMRHLQDVLLDRSSS